MDAETQKKNQTQIKSSTCEIQWQASIEGGKNEPNKYAMCSLKGNPGDFKKIEFFHVSGDSDDAAWCSFVIFK